MLFLDHLHTHCSRLAHKTAIEFVAPDSAETHMVTYRQLEEAVQRTMTMLQSYGVEAGDRVALQLPKCLPFLYLHLAIMRLGAISLPLNPGYPPHELHYFLEDAAAKLFVADSANRNAIDPLQPTLPELQHILYLDPFSDQFDALIAGRPATNTRFPANTATIALMIYTSGTTGRPKGATLTHGNITANLNSLHTAWGWQEQDVLLHVLPIFHVHGLIVALHGALNAGATAVLLPKFDGDDVIDRLISGKYSVFMGVPTMHRRLLDAARGRDVDFGRMRLMTSGSDRLLDDVFQAYQDRFGYTLLERYGMSETGMLISNPLHGERRIGSVGLPLPGVSVRIVDPEMEQQLPDGTVGAVQVKGDNVCPGYWRKPEKWAEAFTPDGWLRTGDMGVRAPDGYYTLKGRAKDLIITGGYNVYPPEVELVLAGHPAVTASAVVGCPDRDWGETVAACVVLQPNSKTTEDELIAYCRERLVHYKAPRRVVFMSDFPRNALGKVQKAELRRLLTADA